MLQKQHQPPPSHNPSTSTADTSINANSSIISSASAQNATITNENLSISESNGSQSNRTSLNNLSTNQPNTVVTSAIVNVSRNAMGDLENIINVRQIPSDPALNNDIGRTPRELLMFNDPLLSNRDSSTVFTNEALSVLDESSNRDYLPVTNEEWSIPTNRNSSTTVANDADISPNRSFPSTIANEVSSIPELPPNRIEALSIPNGPSVTIPEAPSNRRYFPTCTNDLLDISNGPSVAIPEGFNMPESSSNRRYLANLGISNGPSFTNTALSLPPIPGQNGAEVNGEGNDLLPKYRRDLASKLKMLRTELFALQPQSGHCRLEVSPVVLYYNLIGIDINNF